jgi:tetratricopeptide (TPR) repeat protein
MPSEFIPPAQPASDATGEYRPASPRVRSDRYLLERFHARGGMGEIWLATDVEIGRPVALKRILRGREDQHDRFLVEAQITGQLEHPGVVPVHELGLDETGQPFYVMKFVEGRTLKAAIEEYHAAPPAAGVPREVQRLRLLEVFLDLCQAVAYAHSRGVLHRDLKPDNVMLGRYGETLVLDWGLAKARNRPDSPSGPTSVHLVYGDSTKTQAGSVIGSPPYMAPEVAEGASEAADERTDIYLLGATLYEILTGRAPRQGNSRDELIEMARSVVPAAPRQINGQIPRALEAICLKAMARRKPDRYAAVAELAEDVQRYLAGEPVSAYREGVLGRAWRWVKRHRRAVGRTVAAVVVLGLTLFGLARLREAERRRQEAEADAVLLRQIEQARKEVKEFRERADEMRYYAASTNPVAEHAPFFEPRQGEAASQAALAIAANWGPGLDHLPLTEEDKKVLKKELHELQLLTVQLRAASLAGRANPQEPRELLTLLDASTSLEQPPSRSEHRLRAECYRLLGEPRQAAEEQRQAERLPAASALDHFLLGEQYRMESTAAAGERPDRLGDPGLLNKAVEQYRLALVIDPGHYWAHFQRGRCYLSLGRAAEAVEALGACIALRPEAPWGYSARGFALAVLKRFREAERDLNGVVQQYPEFQPGRLNRGVVSWLQGERGKGDAALEDFQAVLQAPQGRRLIEAAYYRGQVYLQRGDQAKALEDFDRVVAEKPSFRPVYLSRARLLLLRGEEAAGVEDLNAFLAGGLPFDPKSKEACERRGRLLLRLADQEPEAARPKLRLLARTELQRAKELGAKSAALCYDLGLVLEHLGQVREAVRVYSEGLEQAPAHVELLVKRGWSHVNFKQFDKAQADFARAVREAPSNAEARTGLGYVRACQKAAGEAGKEADLALLHGAGDYLILHNVACIHAALSQADARRAAEHQDRAVAVLQRAVELWKLGGAGPDEIQQIRNEPAFPPALLARPEIDKLLKGGKR